jgi:hypothetical protein
MKFISNVFFMMISGGHINAKKDFRIIIDELDKQYWVDSLEGVDIISKQPVISVTEWNLERK